MMIKKVGDRKESSAGRVIDYIQRALDYLQRANMKEEDRPVVFMGNCISEDIELCKIEIKSTQEQNIRSKADKTYHMIISFSPEDKLNTELHKKIVADICKELGFGEHQRVCAIHTDTDNEHCHVIINKIHPKTFNIVSPFQDGLKMNEIAAGLERKYNLTVINHSNEKVQKNNKHKDGILSFNQWVINEAKDPIETIIKANGDWQNVSDELAKYNLHIRKRGNGLVISDCDKPLFIKASSVSRLFKGLGSLPPNLKSPQMISSIKYERIPLTGKNELWQKYQYDKDNNRKAKTMIYKSFRELKGNVYKAAKLQGIEVRFAKSLKGLAKKQQYQHIRKGLKTKLAELEMEKRKALSKHNTGNWLDYLIKDYNENGNIDALEQLKKSNIFNPKFKNEISGTTDGAGFFSQVNKAGNSFEQVGKCKIFLVDDTLKTQSDDLAVATRVLDIALEKYELPLVVDGSEKFIKAIQISANIKGIKINIAGEEVKQETELKSKAIEK